MGAMAQANRSTSGAIAPLPAGGPLVENGAPPESALLPSPVAPAPVRFETPPPSQVDAPVPPRPVPDLDPMPVTAADFEDEAAPGLLASLGSTRPTTWLALGLGALAVAFAVGLFVGRGMASGPAPAPRVAVSEPARAPATAQVPAFSGAPETVKKTINIR